MKDFLHAMPLGRVRYLIQYFGLQRLIKMSILLYAFVAIFSSLISPAGVNAQWYPEPGTPIPGGKFAEPLPCASGQGDRPATQRQGLFCPDIASADPNADTQNITLEYACTYQEWVDNPELNFWVQDPEVTALGKSGERSRQFLLWALTRQSIDDHPVILDVWRLSQNVALFLILIVVIIMGIGIIIGRRGIGFMGSSFSLNVELTPLIIRIAILLLYIVFSARIVLLFIQLSDVMMEFFIRTLGVRDLFNIFFVDNAGNVSSIVENLSKSEQAYREFIGCTNWNINNQEMVNTSKALVKFTNMTYYFIGGMLLLRKIVLWFLTVVSPFLAILAPFVFIRNVGWIWVGVFFQWIFYGPLMALFLGALANIWNSPPTHIPYIFDFSRTHKLGEMVYPTSINILYGGPAQQLGVFNTSNYVDTFAEYIISLMMLWTVLILPWWLLRIFRDYCCDGIYAMKNVLLAMYDEMRGGPPTPPGPGPVPTPMGTGRTALEIKQPQNVPIQANIQLDTPQQIRQAQTQQIIQSMNIQASKLQDVARMETSSVSQQQITSTLDKLQNPFKAETPSERQKLMNMRNEVQTRAQKGDLAAQRLAAVTARSSVHERVAKEQILSSMPKIEVPMEVKQSSMSQVQVALPAAKRQTVVQNTITNIYNNQNLMKKVSEKSGVPVQQSTTVLQTLNRFGDLDTSTDDVIAESAQEAGLQEEQVKKVIESTVEVVQPVDGAPKEENVVDAVARNEELEEDVVVSTVTTQLQKAIGETDTSTQGGNEPEQGIEDFVPKSQKVSIEDYEEVKSMWVQHYENGEVPLTENLSSREEWVEQDVIRITNILNKLMSSNRQVQEQGLDEVGYILPVFMVNNLSGEELLVYLKAKIQAAKQISRELKKEQKLREEMKDEDEENLVEVERTTKKAEEKKKVLRRELPIEEEKKEDDGEKSLQDQLQENQRSENAPVSDASVEHREEASSEAAANDNQQALGEVPFDDESQAANDPSEGQPTDPRQTELDEIKKRLAENA